VFLDRLIHDPGLTLIEVCEFHPKTPTRGGPTFCNDPEPLQIQKNIFKTVSDEELQCRTSDIANTFSAVTQAQSSLKVEQLHCESIF